MTAKGWQALWDHGVRTVVDLRNPDEIKPDARPAGLATLALALDGQEDREFWSVWAEGPVFGTPLYYRPFLERMPERAAAVLTALAEAPAGGVLFHCGRGRDRTGLIAILVLQLCQVEPEAIASDYCRSGERLGGEETRVLHDYLREQGLTPREAVLKLLEWLDVERQLALRPAIVTALRIRLL